MNEYKKNLTLEICDFLKNRNEVLAIWEGGSAATGFEDEWSDLDLITVTEHKAGDEIFEALDQLLDSAHGIVRRHRVPEPAWHGMSQCFYQLKDSPEFFYCDLATVDKDNPNKLTERDRHGTARVYYDPQRIFAASSTPEQELDAIARRVWQSVTGIDFVLSIELGKAMKRGIMIDCISLYQSFIQRCLIPLLNLKYRPHKADFGYRYIHRDFPKEVVLQIENLFEDITSKNLSYSIPILLKLYEETKQELSTRFATP